MPVIQADARHVDAVWTLLQRCRDALAREGIFQWDDVYPTRATVEHDVRDGALWVLEVDGDVLAAITLNEHQDVRYAEIDWHEPEPALVVHRLCVDPDIQGRGLAHQLMAHGEALAAERGYRSIRLDAYSANPRSLSFYRRRGFREAGTCNFARRTELFYLFELGIGDPTARVTE